jgi:dipeptidyl aminopeptidase/acylaminoacyl peptidase
MNRPSTLAVCAALLATTLPAPAQDRQQGGSPAAAKPAAKPDPHALTLENLFPKKGFFGPSAADLSISRTGRYAAWLHRPYLERRHGNDLYLLEFATGTVRRATDATVLATFQASAREVLADRAEKAKKRKADEKAADKAAAEGAGAAEQTADDAARQRARDNMHVDQSVGEKDADDEKAPRYSGIGSVIWAPDERDELLFTAERDLYRYLVAEDRIERLTRTSERVSRPAWLPDASGYTYLDEGRLVRVRFGSHLFEEIQPRLPAGETLTGYELSPDGQRVVFVTRKGEARSGGRTVKIARYTDRFMDVREVPRTVSDDPIPKTESFFYLYELSGVMQENGPLYRIHEFDTTGPRDVVQTPQWAPDSSRVVFATFEQGSSQVVILQAEFPTGDRVAELAKAAAAKDKDRKPHDPIAHDAAVLYRFLHDGGPNTPRMIAPQYLADSREVLFLSEQSGFRHLHVLDPTYQSQRQLTFGRFEVYPLRLSHDRRSVFVEATKEHPSRLDVYRVDIESGAMERRTPKDGIYEGAAFGDDGQGIANFVSWGEGPAELCHIGTDRSQTQLTDSHPDVARVFTAREPELFDYRNRHGQTIHGFLFEPERAEGEKRPLLIYVYGGPLGTRKNVVDGTYQSDGYLFARYMTEVHGYLTCTIDPRGMSGYGALFEKANFEQVGRPQVEDLVDGVKHLIATRGVDPGKVGIHGWSFGGFQTQMCLYTEPEVFQVGMAGAGPTEWHNYNSWYSTGTIGSSREGRTDLDKYSLLPLAKNLKGRLLLIHGMEDSNVLYQDTVRVYRELLKAGKESLVELFLDPTGGHGLGGDVERIGRARKYEEFLTRTLGSVGKAGKAAAGRP